VQCLLALLAVHSVVKYSEQKLFGIECIKYLDSTVLHKTVTSMHCKLCYSGSVHDDKSVKYILAEEKFDDTGAQLAANSTTLSVWVGREWSLCW
jgi:hypothetical protein